MKRHLLHITLLFCVVAAVFHRTILAEISLVDDMTMIQGMLEAKHFDLPSIFFPGGGSGVYYRPLIGLSFWVEKHFWNLHPSLLHLDNILCHLANVLLLYLLALRILADDLRRGYAPLAAALLFALHPLVNESVAWISGRTDLLATFFILLSAIFLYRFREKGKRRHLVMAALLLVPGVLAKETALAFPLAAAWLLTPRREASLGTTNAPRMQGKLIRRAAWGVAGTLAFLLAAWLLRKAAFTSMDRRITHAVELILGAPGDTLCDMIAASGFYLKKFLLPLPLNFTITVISPWYLPLGIGEALLCLWCARRRDLPAVLFLAGSSLILPALLVVSNAVTWTPYAERYGYPALPFWILAAIIWGNDLTGRFRISSRATSAAVIGLILVSAAICWERNGLWLSNVALMADSVEKAPLFVRARQYYMLALATKGDKAGARREQRIALAMASNRFVPEQDLTLAEDLLRRGLHEKLFPFVEGKMRAEQGDTPRLYETMRLFYRELYQRTGDERVAARIISYDEIKGSLRTPLPLTLLLFSRGTGEVLFQENRELHG